MSRESDKGDKRDRGDKGNGSGKRDKSDKGYHRLVLWQKAHEFVVCVYKETNLFPKSELYGLTSQLRRAALSVPANIVEGHSRDSKKDFLRFLSFTRGSLAECEYFLELALDLDFMDKASYESFEHLRMEVGYLLYSFIKTIKER